MLEGVELLRLAGARMRYLEERQKLISQNIANVDTPGYRAQDLAPFSFPTALLASRTDLPEAPLHLVRSSLRHMEGADSGLAVQQAASTSEKPDGNTVSLEEQMVKLNGNASAFDLASVAYAKSIGLLKLAIGGA